MDLSDEDWRFAIANGLDIVWFSVRAAWSELVRRGGGSIINVASIAVRLGARFVGQVRHGSAILKRLDAPASLKDEAHIST